MKYYLLLIIRYLFCKYIFRLILDYYSQHPPPWIHSSPSDAKKKKVNEDVKIVENVLFSLNLAAKHFRNLWNWSEFCNYYLNHHETYVVW